MKTLILLAVLTQLIACATVPEDGYPTTIVSIGTTTLPVAQNSDAFTIDSWGGVGGGTYFYEVHLTVHTTGRITCRLFDKDRKVITSSSDRIRATGWHKMLIPIGNWTTKASSVQCIHAS